MTTRRWRTVSESGQIVLRYRDNPNGSRGDIAGLANERGNVVGLMPHPERAMSTLLGSADGRVLLRELRRLLRRGLGPKTHLLDQ